VAAKGGSSAGLPVFANAECRQARRLAYHEVHSLAAGRDSLLDWHRRPGISALIGGDSI
jgi:hypothetical protein